MAVNFTYKFCSKVVNKPKGIIIESGRNKPSQSYREVQRAKKVAFRWSGYFMQEGYVKFY